jgi:hypothetical protein
LRVKAHFCERKALRESKTFNDDHSSGNLNFHKRSAVFEARQAREATILGKRHFPVRSAVLKGFSVDSLSGRDSHNDASMADKTKLGNVCAFIDTLTTADPVWEKGHHHSLQERIVDWGEERNDHSKVLMRIIDEKIFDIHIEIQESPVSDIDQ